MNDEGPQSTAELTAAAEAFYRDAGPGYAGRLAAVESWRREHL